MNIVTALGNEEFNNKLKEKKELEIIGKDLQYQEAVIEMLEENNEIDLLILSSILPGQLNIKEFINIIKYKNSKIEIFIILEKEDEKLKEFIVSKGIDNIYYNNKITFEEIINKINDIENKNIINNKINKLEEIILEKNNIINFKKIIKKLKNKINIKKLKNNKKYNNKIISIIGAKKIGKTIFSLILSLNIKNKKILIIDFNSEENNMKIILGKKVKNEKITWKNNIDILFLKNNEKIIEKNKINNYLNKYDYIIVDIGDVCRARHILEISQDIILLVEANLLGLKETRDILEEVINNQRNQKDNVKIVYSKQNYTSINTVILNKIFSDFKKIGETKYNNNYNLFINSNTKYLNKKINNEYLKIIKKIM